MATAWSQTNSYMLGQFYRAETDTHFGSIFKNEMEFHMFTRTRDGFCDKCDQNPTERTNEQGYKLPGHRFHSKAMQFQDTFFNNWQSDVLFTEVKPAVASCTVFKLDNKGTFLDDLLTRQDCFRLLAGTLRETEEFRDFVTCEDAKIGLKIHLQNNVETKFEIYPNHFQIYFGDPEWDAFPTHVVNEIGYGYVILARFDCDYNEIDSLISHVQLFAECLKGTSDLGVLDGLPSCTMWIGPASYQNTCSVIQSPCVQSFRSAYNDVLNYIKIIMIVNNGKGFCIWQDLKALRDNERFVFDMGQNQLLLKVNKIPEGYTPIKVSEVKDFNPVVLCKIILQISKDLRQCRTNESRYLQVGFNSALQNFRKKLYLKIYLHDIGQSDVDDIEYVIRDYEYCDFSPRKVRQLLRELKKRGDIESSKLDHILPLKRKGVNLFPSCEIKGEYVVLEFSNFQKIRNHQSWDENIEFFKTLITTEEQIPSRRRRYYIKELGTSNSTVSLNFYNGVNAISLNMLQQYRLRNTGTTLTGIVKYSSSPRTTTPVLSNDLFGLPCVSSIIGGCQIMYKNWLCTVCNAYLRYVDYQNSVSCECGLAPLQACSFKCLDKNHGVLPHYMPMNYENCLPRGEINLLLIGESGVGKSTLINSLVNYQDFNNFQDSFNRMKFFYLVPIKSVDRNTKKMETVRHQKRLIPKCYLFSLTGSRVVRIIDTPGFRSTPDNVSLFLAMILNYAKQFSMIHGVCFVIKATDNLLSDGLRSLLQVLLTTFMAKDTKNIIFLFTHCDNNNDQVTRITNELSAICLESGLIDQNPIEASTFRMNNVAFPYLARNMWNITNKSPDFVSFEKAWKEAFQEFNRMFEYVSELRPFDPALNLRHEERYLTQQNVTVASKQTFQGPTN